jgi:preprotein translocase subunit SecG|tara:strand:- start:129 stop:506 length:378 start_codon:yes stop_codon:yes gene_type:complete
MSTFSIFVALIMLVCFLLVLVIMVQNPKGGGLSSSFGGGSQQMGGVQKTSDFLDRSTWILATLLLALILVSNITLSSGNDVLDSKLLDDSSTPENFENPIEQPVQEIPETDTNQNLIPEIPEAGN